MTNKKDLSIITHDMSEHDRANYLKKKYINIICDKSTNSINVVEYLNKQSDSVIRKELRELAKTICIYKNYEGIGDTNIDAYFSRNKLDESIQNSVDKTIMYYVIHNLESIVENSIKIEEHKDNKQDKNIKSVHELLSLIEINENNNPNIIVIKITVKEAKTLNTKNVVYSVANLDKIKKAICNPPSVSENNNSGTQVGSRLLPNISLPLLINHVNNSDVLRYIPNELLTANQIIIKEEGIKRYNEKKKYQISKKNSI